MPGTASKNKGRLWIAVGLLLAALTALLLLSGDRQDSRVAVDDGTGTIWITPIADLPVNSFARSDFIQDNAGTAYTGGAYTASQGSMLLSLDWQSESRVVAVFDTYIAGGGGGRHRFRRAALRFSPLCQRESGAGRLL